MGQVDLPIIGRLSLDFVINALPAQVSSVVKKSWSDRFSRWSEYSRELDLTTGKVVRVQNPGCAGHDSSESGLPICPLTKSLHVDLSQRMPRRLHIAVME